jgi:hypothetical protein
MDVGASLPYDSELVPMAALDVAFAPRVCTSSWAVCSDVMSMLQRSRPPLSSC